MKVTLINYTKNPLHTIDEAASKCYDSTPLGGKIAESCIKSGHTSVTEFADFTFEIEGVSRALLAQLTRHRVGVSFAVQSQRYCSMENFDYVTPHTVKRSEEALKLYDKVISDITTAYSKLQELGIPNEDARMILPNACCTKLSLKMNLRALMHFCNERLCTRAQWEIRELCKEMVKCVLIVEPELKDYLVPKCEANKNHPFCPESKSCGRYMRLDDFFNCQTVNTTAE